MSIEAQIGQIIVGLQPYAPTITERIARRREEPSREQLPRRVGSERTAKNLIISTPRSFVFF